jgi:hypothetical protein
VLQTLPFNFSSPFKPHPAAHIHLRRATGDIIPCPYFASATLFVSTGLKEIRKKAKTWLL